MAAAFDDSVDAYLTFCSSNARRAHHASNCFILTGSGRSALICLWKSSYATSGWGVAIKSIHVPSDRYLQIHSQYYSSDFLLDSDYFFVGL